MTRHMPNESRLQTFIMSFEVIQKSKILNKLSK